MRASLGRTTVNQHGLTTLALISTLLGFPTVESKSSKSLFLKFYCIQQRDAMDCGPASLAMIVRHYGRTPDLDFIRLKSDLGKDGVSLLGISKTAEKMGFKTLAGDLNYSGRRSPNPLIVHWDQNHFVVDMYKDVS